MKNLLSRIIVLIILQGLIGGNPFNALAVDFFDGKSVHGTPALRWDTKIPIGVIGQSVAYITILKGTPLAEIPNKISKKRKEVGLSPDIPLNEQNEFFQNLSWKTPKVLFVKPPLPGRVVKMNVHPGQQIVAKDIVGTIECMKMHIDIRAGAHGELAHALGEIRDVFFKAGDMIDRESDFISYVPPDPDWEDLDQAKILDNKDLLALLFSWGARTPPAGPSAPSPNKERKNTRPIRILENKDFMILLFPWMAPGTTPGVTNPPTSPPPPMKGSKGNALNSLIDPHHHRAFTSPNVPLSKATNSALESSDQNQARRKDSDNIPLEKSRNLPVLWQTSMVTFHQKEIRTHEFADTSGSSTSAWACGFYLVVVLSKIAFAIKSVTYNIVRRSRIRKSAFILSFYPRTVYLHAPDFNTHWAVKNKSSHNMNRRYFARWRFG